MHMAQLARFTVSFRRMLNARRADPEMDRLFYFYFNTAV